MDTFKIELDDGQFEELNVLFPEKTKSATIGNRAIAILKIHFRKMYPSCGFRENFNGADLEVSDSMGNVLDRMEVKGTNNSDVSWRTLKASSESSYRALCGGLKVYRVCGVNNRIVNVFVMTHGHDFILISESRWRFKRS